jgi:integrase
MKAKVSFLASVKDGHGNFPRVPVEIARQRVVFPIAGRFTRDDVTGFYCRHRVNGRRILEPLGKDPLAAYSRYQQIEQDFARTRVGLLPINEPPKPTEPDNDKRLKACATEYKANLIALGKAKSTVASYGRAVDDLVGQFPLKAIDEITEQDMIGHVAFLRTNLPKRCYGDKNTTLRNRLRNINVFFHAYGVNPPLAMRKLKKPMRTRPVRFSAEVLRKLFKVATQDERDLISFFLETGFRDEEVAYATYSDIHFDVGSLNVYAKPQYDWKPKDSDIREQDIVLRKPFLDRMKARIQRNSAKPSSLIFPGVLKGNPDMHLIRHTQDVAERAGITVRVTQHMYRRTFGSMVAQKYGLEQARIWLGHTDIETTQAYIAAEEMTTEESRKKVDDMFAELGLEG